MEHSATPTLGFALDWLKQTPLDDKRDLKSAVETACRWFNKPPAQVPFDPIELRRLFGTVSPGKVGVTKKRFTNVKSGVGRLLDLMGIGARKTHNNPLSPQWEALTAQIEDEYTIILLRRFGRYCSARKVEPQGVCDGIADEFLRSLELELRVRDPLRAHRETVRLWNRLALSPAPWPRQLLAVPSYSRKYVLSWEAFYPSLIEDVENYLAKQSTDDPFDLSAPIRQLKASSIHTYRDRLRRFASCLVLTGTDPSELRSLSDLVQMEAVQRGLRYLAQERRARSLAGTIATLLAAVAQDHVGRPDEEVAAISKLGVRLRGKKKGLSAKVRQRLSPLKHEANLARLFVFPIVLARGLMRKPALTPADAHLMQRALALALLTVCPLRIGSMCSIRTDRHLNWSAGPMKGDLLIEFAEGELKGDEPASFPIPQEIANLIRVYCSRFRPLLDPCGSPFLFCGGNPEKPKSKSGFSTQLSRLTFDKVGMSVYPHLFRHIVHLVVLRRFPGAYAMVARVLTHRSIATTIENYAHFDGEISMRTYQRLVQDVIAGGRREHAAEAAVVAYALDRERPIS